MVADGGGHGERGEGSERGGAQGGRERQESKRLRAGCENVTAFSSSGSIRRFK